MSQAIEAMIAVMGEVRALAKDQRNPSQGFKFRGIDDLMNVVGPALRKHGIIVSPQILNVEHGQIQGRNGPMGHTVIQMRYYFYAADGSNFFIEGAGEASDAADKSVSKAMSMAYKYALLEALCLPTDEADPDEEHPERAPEQVTQDEAKTVRDKILDWANENGVKPPDIAARFKTDHGVAITQASVEQLNEFYAKIRLGAEEVPSDPHGPAHEPSYE